VSSVRSVSSVYYYRAWRVGTRIGRICADLHRFRDGPPAGRDSLSRSVSSVRSASSVYPCRAWHEGTQIRLIARIYTDSREGPPAGRVSLGRSVSSVYPCRAWHEGTQIGLIARIAQIPGRSSSGAGLVGQISEISQISVISVLLSCVAGWNTDWTDCTDFHRFREGHREEQHIMTKIKVNERNHPKASPKHLQLPASDYPPRA
jgi:hypothetical protein